MFEQTPDPMGGSLTLSAPVAVIPLGTAVAQTGLLVIFTGLVYLQSTPVLGWMVP